MKNINNYLFDIFNKSFTTIGQKIETMKGKLEKAFLLNYFAYRFPLRNLS